MVNGSVLLDKIRVLKQLRLVAMLLQLNQRGTMLVKQYVKYKNEHNKQDERIDKRHQLNGHKEISEWLNDS